MQNAVKHIGAVVSRILFIGLSAQIVLGLLWMFCAFDGMQEFRATEYYLEAADSLKFDEYAGILYPFILILVNGVERLLGIPYAPMMYFLQIVLAFVAGCCLVSAVGVDKKLWKVWGSLVLMTFPMAMQCHMAILPDSFAYSCFLLMLAGVLEAAKTVKKTSQDGLGQKRKLWQRVRSSAGIYVFWILTVLLLPENLYLGAIPVLFFGGYVLLRERSIWLQLVLFILSIGTITGVNVMILGMDSLNTVRDSVEATVFRRFCWTDFAGTYYYWPQELKAVVSDDLFAEIAGEAANMEQLFQPMVEDVLGAEEAEEWYGMVAKALFAKNSRLLLFEMAMDAGGYALPPIMLDIALDGINYSSFGMRNYEVMRQDHPLLTRYYIDYSIRWFTVGIILTAGMFALKKLTEVLAGGLQKDSHYIGEASTRGGFVFWTLMISAGASVLWYTMQNTGLWDYKKALLAGCLWMLWMMKAVWDNIGGMSDCPEK